MNNLDVHIPPATSATGHIPCNSSTPPNEIWKCGTSNIGAGLALAHDAFSYAQPYRPEARWGAMLIADEPANRATYDPRQPQSDPQYGTCPTSEITTTLKCRDADANSRHFVSPHPAVTPYPDPLYDTDDYARDMGEMAGLNPSVFQFYGWYLDIRVFTVALGKTTVCLSGYYTAPANGQPAICANPDPAYGDPDAGEQLLRYIADISDDGYPDTGPCLDTASPYRDSITRFDPSGRSDDVGLGLDCGNYYFAPDATSLPTITLDIATRIITGSEPLPAFSAEPLIGPAPLVVTFTNQSSDYTSVLWQFGDGAVSAAVNPTHTYVTAGVFTVTLTLTNPTTSVTYTQTNYITAHTPMVPGAPADIVLVLDRSESQSYDFASLPSPYNDYCAPSYLNDLYACVNGGVLGNGTTVAGCNNEPVSDPNFPELTRGICQPFRKSKEAAYQLDPAIAAWHRSSGRHQLCRNSNTCLELDV